jgi:hypothetical protein
MKNETKTYLRSNLRSIAATLSILALLNATLHAAVPQTSSSTAPQAVAQAPGAPIPSQIATAHTVFLSNMGSDSNFPIDATQAYNAIYQDLQTWGKYQLAASPEQADLIFQLRDVSTYTTYYGNHGTTYTINHPSFQLTIVDAKSNVTLWTINSPVYLAGKKQTLARWEALAETNLISRIKVVAGQPLSNVETADLTTAPKTHGKALAYILVGSIVGAGVAGGLILHHEFENSLANQKATQDAFCKANNIPLSECAGG